MFRLWYFVIFQLLVLPACFVEACDILIFKAGEASFNIVKSGNSALVVDCGIKRSDMRVSQKDSFEKDILRFIENTKLCILITHQHYDHFSYFSKLVELITKNEKSHSIDLKGVLVGGKIGKKTDKMLASHARAAFGEIYRNGEVTTCSPSLSSGNILLTSDFIQKQLETDELEVTLLLPEHSVSDSEHEQNLVVKICTREGTNILFPGDASGRLIETIANDNPGCFSDIDIWLLPHHGSILNNELKLYEILFESSHFPCLSIISSDSNGANKLPKSVVTSLCFDRILSKTEASSLFPCHWVVDHSVQVHCETPPPASKEILVGRRPVFITSEASASYYKVSISTDGLVSLYDGDKSDPLFIGVRWRKDEKEFAKSLFLKLKQGQARVSMPTKYQLGLTHMSKNILVQLVKPCESSSSLLDINELIGIVELWPSSIQSAEDFDENWADFLWKNGFLRIFEEDERLLLETLLHTYVQSCSNSYLSGIVESEDATKLKRNSQKNEMQSRCSEVVKARFSYSLESKRKPPNIFLDVLLSSCDPFFKWFRQKIANLVEDQK